MKILAFDLGSTWACAHNMPLGDDPPGTCYAHHKDLNPDRAKVKLRRERPEVLGRFLDTVGQVRSYDVVVFERPFARGQAATRLLWGMAGVLEAVAHRDGAAILDMTPGEIKLWAYGKGNAEKADMLEAAGILGYRGDNEHEADAWCLLKFAEATLTKEPA